MKVEVAAVSGAGKTAVMMGARVKKAAAVAAQSKYVNPHLSLNINK